MKFSKDLYKSVIRNEYFLELDDETVNKEIARIQLATEICINFSEGTKNFYKRFNWEEIGNIIMLKKYWRPLILEAHYLATQWEMIEGLLYRNPDNTMTSEAVGSHSTSWALNANSVQDYQTVYRNFFQKPCMEALAALMAIDYLVDFRLCANGDVEGYDKNNNTPVAIIPAYLNGHDLTNVTNTTIGVNDPNCTINLEVEIPDPANYWDKNEVALRLKGTYDSAVYTSKSYTDTQITGIGDTDKYQGVVDTLPTTRSDESPLKDGDYCILKSDSCLYFYDLQAHNWDTAGAPISLTNVDTLVGMVDHSLLDGQHPWRDVAGDYGTYDYFFRCWTANNAGRTYFDVEMHTTYIISLNGNIDVEESYTKSGTIVENIGNVKLQCLSCQLVSGNIVAFSIANIDDMCVFYQTDFDPGSAITSTNFQKIEIWKRAVIS